MKILKYLIERQLPQNVANLARDEIFKRFTAKTDAKKLTKKRGGIVAGPAN